MTIEDQRWLFEILTPQEFMNVYIHQRKKYGYSMPICTFIGIRILQEHGEIISQKHITYIEKLTPFFGDLDISHYKRFYIPVKDPFLFNPINVLKDIHFELLEQTKKAHKPAMGIDHAGFIEFVKTLNKNLGFSKNDMTNKGIGFNRKGLYELFECFDNFKGKVYYLDDNIKITLSAPQFIHILVGHVESYKIPRKGKLIQFKNIHYWKDLLFLIDKIIDSIKNDLIKHYINSKIEYNNTGVRLENNQYGIHIGRYGDIRTIYEVVEKL